MDATRISQPGRQPLAARLSVTQLEGALRSLQALSDKPSYTACLFSAQIAIMLPLGTPQPHQTMVALPSKAAPSFMTGEGGADSNNAAALEEDAPAAPIPPHVHDADIAGAGEKGGGSHLSPHPVLIEAEAHGGLALPPVVGEVVGIAALANLPPPPPPRAPGVDKGTSPRTPASTPSLPLHHQIDSPAAQERSRGASRGAHGRGAPFFAGAASRSRLTSRSRRESPPLETSADADVAAVGKGKEEGSEGQDTLPDSSNSFVDQDKFFGPPLRVPEGRSTFLKSPPRFPTKTAAPARRMMGRGEEEEEGAVESPSRGRLPPPPPPPPAFPSGARGRQQRGFTRFPG